MEQSHTLKPYLMQAVYNWCIDTGMTPYLEVVDFDKNKIPPFLFAKSPSMVFDISKSGVSKFAFSTEGIRFQTKINKQIEHIFLNYHSIKKIYAKEAGHGLEFETFMIANEALETAEQDALLDEIGLGDDIAASDMATSDINTNKGKIKLDKVPPKLEPSLEHELSHKTDTKLDNKTENKLFLVVNNQNLDKL